MTIECNLSKAEMSEAFRMNLTGGFWFRTMLGNIRAIILVGVVLFAAGAKIMNHDTHDWQSIGILFAVAAALVALYVWRLSSTIKKTAAKVNTACDRMTLDSQGIATASTGGSTSFTPWSQFKKWKEGKLVFTVGDGKTFRTMPKSAMSEMQVGEVRGVLQTQIR
jgi:hypothetical protein